jgi:PAS domain S-box-containing protein
MRYGIAVLSVATALLIKSFVDPLLAAESPFLFFFAAVIISAWYGGLGPGLAALALSALLGDFLFLTPFYSFFGKPAGQYIRLAAFVAEGMLIIWLISALQAARRKDAASLCEARRFQAQLQRSEEQLRLLFEHVKDYAILALDANGRVTVWNKGAELAYGYAEKEITGCHFSCFYPPEEAAQGIPDSHLKTAAESGSVTTECWQVRRDGTRFWARLNLAALRDETGARRGFSLVTRDITRRKLTDEERASLLAREQQARAEAEASEARYRFLAEALPQSVWMARPDGWLEYFNQHWFDYTGLSLEQSQGLRWQAAIHPADLEGCLDLWAKAVATGEGFQHECRLKRASDGAFRWHLVRTLAVRDAGGQIIKWLGTFTDIDDQKRAEEELQRGRLELEARIEQRTAALTQINQILKEQVIERKRAEENLRRSAAQLEASNRELQDFAFIASHDLQEPLRKVQAFSDRLLAKYGDRLGDDGRESLRRMQSAAARMRTLIDDLLTFSRVTTKAQPFVPVHLAQVAREVVSDLEARIEQTGGRVEIGFLPVIDADPLQMRQLLQNLISNALKFVRPGVSPVVKIYGQFLNGQQKRADDSLADIDCCQILVEDNGIGFDMKYLDRIFTVFQRLHSRADFEGTGIGLAVCRKIVARHGGTITARSKPGEGSTFIVTLPIRQTHAGGEEQGAYTRQTDHHLDR